MADTVQGFAMLLQSKLSGTILDHCLSASIDLVTSHIGTFS
jgi:hypothetical protein